MDETLRTVVREKLFEARMSRIYHERRRAVFRTWSQALKFVSAFGATTVFFAVFNGTGTYFGVEAQQITAFAAIVVGIAQFIDFA